MQNQLRNIPDVKQVQLADDATGAGKISSLKSWWDTLVAEGEKCGYHVNAGKSWIISKNETIQMHAKQVFSPSGVKFTTSGKRHLGACIGSQEFRNEYVTKKVQEWCDEMRQHSAIALNEPQAAFAAFTHGELHCFKVCVRALVCLDGSSNLPDCNF